MNKEKHDFFLHSNDVNHISKDAAILGRHFRDAVEQVLHCSSLLKYGSGNGCRHSAILQDSLRQG